MTNEMFEALYGELPTEDPRAPHGRGQDVPADAGAGLAERPVPVEARASGLDGPLPTDLNASAADGPVPPSGVVAGAEPELTEEFVRDALRLVVDPELGLDIVTLGLVYQVSVERGVVTVVHTLTTPGCPMEHVIGDGIETVLGAARGVREVKRHLVFEPEWHPGMIAEEGWA